MTAYARREETYEARLTEVSRETPMGELMRRYWHPVALCSEPGKELVQVEAGTFLSGGGRA
jgi:hypothetical protein